MSKLKSLGILGGTFDPVHYGHLTAAQCAYHEFKLDRVIFVPSAQPPHKDLNYVSDCQDRLAMLEKAVAGNPAFEISTLEMERQGYSYTVDTIQYFLKAYPQIRLYFIIGIDALLLINTWKEVEQLVGLCQFIAVNRPGFMLDRNDEVFTHVPAVLWDNLHLLDMPGSLVSSSAIRRRAAQGEPIKYLLPAAVEEYIIDKGLYRPRS